MKNVTLSADARLIARARSVARARGTTLNAAFSEWLVQFVAIEGEAKGFDALMKKLCNVDAGGHFSRDELNRR